jgi:tetratricopeptide (TPR) repeat protein
MIYGLFGCLLLSAGCRNNQEEVLLPGLVQAEAIIWNEQEKAQAILDTIKIPAGDNYQYATWCLLYTLAQNRDNINYTSDSLIRVAVRYFEPRDDIHRKAMTWFYAGRVYADLRQTIEAAAFYIKARDAASQTTDHRLQYLICLNYGWLCLNQMALDQAKELLNEAYMHAQEGGVDKYRITALDYIGRYYAFNQQMDSAALFLEQSVVLARQARDSICLQMTLNDAAIVYYRIEKYDQALSYLYESIGLEKNIKNLFPQYYNIGDTYRNLGKADSAVHYLNKALGTENIVLLHSCYFSLAEIKSDAHQWKEAVYYTGLFWQYTDSIALFSHHKEVTELHARSEYQQLENRNSHLKVEKANILKAGSISITCILIIILTLIYIFQQKLLRIEHLRLSVQNRLQEQIQVHQANEQEINKYNKIIHSATGQLSRLPELEKQQDLQDDWLAYIRNHNEQLQQQNLQLDREIAGYLQTLQEKDAKQSVRDRIAEQNQLLQKNVQLLEDGLLRRMQLTGQLKTTPRYLTDEMEHILSEEINIIYPGFSNRLSKQYTGLSAIELLTCCLIKLQFTTSEIGAMTSAEAESVTRRKYRIKEKMQIVQPDIWKKNTSLDAYLWLY